METAPRRSASDGASPAERRCAEHSLTPGLAIGAAHHAGAESNPTWNALENALAVLENAEVVAFPSGMAAISSIFYSQLKSGEQVLLPSDGCYTTRALAERFLAPMGVVIKGCPTAGFETSSFDGFRMVLVETPSNPGLDICDLESAIARAKNAGALVVVDNTTMTPLGQRPLDLGADMVVSSDSKAINGHSDTCFGHVACRNRLSLRRFANGANSVAQSRGVSKPGWFIAGSKPLNSGSQGCVTAQ